MQRPPETCIAAALRSLHTRAHSLTRAHTLALPAKKQQPKAGSAARRDKVDAEVQYLTTLREMNLQLHEIEHELFIIGESMPLSEQHTDMSTRQWEMARTAFELGETDLPSRLRIEAEAATARREAVRLRLEHAAALSGWRQAIGLLP